MNDDFLEVIVLGAGEGEGIVLRLPDGTWGVVDCYARSVSDPDSNPTLCLLRERRVSELEFLCLTHPHQDHYRGMSQLLTQLTVRQFWRPEGMSGLRLQWLIDYERIEAETSGETRAIAAAEELREIFRLTDASGRRGISPELDTGGVNKRLLSRRCGESLTPLEVWSLAPSAASVDRYEASLRRCFDENGQFLSLVPAQCHNMVSMGLLVAFGETRVVLGGDVERDGWSDALRQFTSPSLSADLVKLSHHGSENGYCDGLWERFSADKAARAVLTPYVRHRLPSANGLRHIRKFASEIFTPCLDAICTPSSEKPANASLSSRTALRNKLQAEPPRAFDPGWCRFVLDSLGNLVHCEHSETAGRLPPAA